MYSVQGKLLVIVRNGRGGIEGAQSAAKVIMYWEDLHSVSADI